jgi:uncharacterized protein YcfJ
MKALTLLVAATLALTGISNARAQSSSGVLMRPDGIYLRCDQCGTVQSIEHNVTQGSQHGTAGAIIGAVAGGVLGNQVGRGNGRKLATVGGAVGGGFAGHPASGVSSPISLPLVCWRLVGWVRPQFRAMACLSIMAMSRQSCCGCFDGAA